MSLKSLMLVVAGIGAGVVYMVACGDDDGPSDAGAADANQCDCPAPPPVESKLTWRTGNNPGIIGDAATEGDHADAACLPGERAIGGRCYLADSVGRRVYLRESGIYSDPGNPEDDQRSFFCKWANVEYPSNPAGGVYPAELRADVLCLKLDAAGADAGP
jgi:hypothetical protein